MSADALTFLETYRSGHNELDSKSSCRATGTWVRIPPSPLPEVASSVCFTAGYFIYASNEPKSVLARDLGDCRDNLRNSRSVFLIVWLFMKYGLIICFLLKNTKKYSKIIKEKLKVTKDTKDDNAVSPQMRGYFYAILYVKKMAMVFRMVMPDGNNIH